MPSYFVVRLPHPDPFPEPSPYRRWRFHICESTSATLCGVELETFVAEGPNWSSSNPPLDWHAGRCTACVQATGMPIPKREPPAPNMFDQLRLMKGSLDAKSGSDLRKHDP